MPPCIDPAFALGPFLQLPPYLPSGHGMSMPSGQWCIDGRISASVPSAGAELLAQQPQQGLPMSYGLRPGLQNEITNLSLGAELAKQERRAQQDAKRKAKQAAAAAAAMASSATAGAASPADIRSVTSIASSVTSSSGSVPVLSNPASLSGAIGIQEGVSIAHAPSTTIGSSTCCSTDSVREDGSQDTQEELASARSGFTSDDASEVAPVVHHQPMTSSILLQLLTTDNINMCRNKSDESCVDTGVTDNCAFGAAEAPVSIHTDGSHDLESKIIDPEAADTAADTVKKVVESQSPEKLLVPQDTTTHQRHETSTEPPPTPNLDVVVGTWWDAKDSYYEVCFDDGTKSSCHVKTSRPGGGVRETSGLIRTGQPRGKTAGRIIWGSAFILEMPIHDQNRLQWRSIRGGKDFTWTREELKAEMPQVVRGLKKTSTAADQWQPTLPVSEWQAEESQAQGPMEDNHSSEENSITHKRVWRAVADKRVACPKSRSGKSDKQVAEPEYTLKTPSEVVASPCRRVKGKSGTWRVITKSPQK